MVAWVVLELLDSRSQILSAQVEINLEDHLGLLKCVITDLVQDWRQATRLFPRLRWQFSGSPGLISDGVAAELAGRLGQVLGLELTTKLDGRGTDIQQLGIECTAGKNIKKSHGQKYSDGPSQYIWIQRVDVKSECVGWAGPVRVWYGTLDPTDFPAHEVYHGANVSKATVLQKMQVILEIAGE